MKKMIFFFLSATLSSHLAGAALENLISCQLQNFDRCTNCEERIPASCEDNKFNGSLAVNLKPKKIQWLISDPRTGTEKTVTVDNKTLSLKDLIKTKDPKALAEKQKVKINEGETVKVLAVFFGEKTALYKSRTGKALVAGFKKLSPARSMASVPADPPVAGAVKRAQSLKEKSK